MPSSEVMPKFKAGKLHSGSPSGPIVKNPAQARAIAASEAKVEKKHGANIRTPSSMANKAEYPADHKPAMQVPKGGSSCSKCEYLLPGRQCGNEYYQKFYATSRIPKPVDEFCSDWFSPKSLRIDGK